MLKENLRNSITGDFETLKLHNFELVITWMDQSRGSVPNSGQNPSVHPSNDYLKVAKFRSFCARFLKTTCGS